MSPLLSQPFSKTDSIKDIAVLDDVWFLPNQQFHLNRDSSQSFQGDRLFRSFPLGKLRGCRRTNGAVKFAVLFVKDFTPRTSLGNQQSLVVKELHGRFDYRQPRIHGTMETKISQYLFPVSWLS